MKEYGEQLFIYKLGIYFVIYEWEKSVCFCDEYILFFFVTNCIDGLANFPRITLYSVLR